ncbi:MAG: hypothetical protein QOG71_2346 [Pyrinomonadaceae bacterium]|nr:hypothetical protein [Pyrinomonadaceae bacterium]
MQAMGDHKGVADEIRRQQADVQLPVEGEELRNSNDKTQKRFSAPPARRPPTDERLTDAQWRRRATILLEVVQRYIFDKHLDPLEDDELLAVVKSYDQLFTHAGIPTERIRDVYSEAMAQHGKYLLKVDDYLRAWKCIRPQEGAGFDLRPMGERGSDCALCGGLGTFKKFIPNNVRDPLAGGQEAEFACPYRCKSTLVVRATELHVVVDRINK